MAEDASECLPSLGTTVPTLVPSSFSSRPFNRKAELLSYLILCVAKMPFIPPPASGPTARERPAGNAASATAFPKGPRGDRGGGARERLASDLKQLAKKSQPRSFLPPAKAASGSELHAKGRGGPPAPSQTDGFPARGPEARHHNHVSRGGPAESEAEAKAEAGRQAEEEVGFTLALTPEAVLLLLRRRNSERRQLGAAGACGSSLDPRRPKKAQPATQRRGAQPGDISSIVKVSLLNERHKYDDVEYEEEEEERQRGADEHVVMKCTEWLRGLESGLESAPVRAPRGGRRTSASGGERF